MYLSAGNWQTIAVWFLLFEPCIHSAVFLHQAMLAGRPLPSIVIDQCRWRWYGANNTYSNIALCASSVLSVHCHLFDINQTHVIVFLVHVVSHHDHHWNRRLTATCGYHCNDTTLRHTQHKIPTPADAFCKAAYVRSWANRWTHSTTN